MFAFLHSKTVISFNILLELQILYLRNIFILFYSERHSGITLEQNRVRCGAFWAIFHTISLNIWLLKSWNKYSISWLPFHVDFKSNLITLESLSIFFLPADWGGGGGGGHVPPVPPPPPPVVTPLWRGILLYKTLAAHPTQFKGEYPSHPPPPAVIIYASWGLFTTPTGQAILSTLLLNIILLGMHLEHVYSIIDEMLSILLSCRKWIVYKFGIRIIISPFHRTP